MLLSELILEAEEDEQTALCKMIAQELNDASDAGAKYIYKKSSGTVKHVRLASSDIENAFAKIGVSLQALPGSKIATGAKNNTTYRGTLTQDHGRFKKGATFIVVNTASAAGSKIKNKQLTPSVLGLESEEGVFTPATTMSRKALAGLYGLQIFDEDEIAYFKKLLTLGKGNQFDVEAPSTFNSSDLNRIAIDFGEVFGAIWYTKHTKMSGVNFPSGNNPLADFILSDGTTEKSVSSKVGSGGPPSINAIMAQISRDADYFRDKYGDKVLEVLHIIEDSSTVDGPLLANKVLNTPGYQELVRIMGTDDVSAKSVEKFLGTFDTPEELERALAPFFKVIVKRPKQESVDIIFDHDMKRVGIVSAQIANYLVALFNSNPKYKGFRELLNDAARKISVDQLYTDLTSSSVAFAVKSFDAGDFTWYNNSSTKKPSLKKISFKMGSSKAVDEDEPD